MRSAVLFLYIALFVSVHNTYAQYYDTGTDPASLKWKQIKTDRFTVIFPENYTEGGLVYAKSLEKAYSGLKAIFPEKKNKIPVIIHNYSTRSNGYVSWAPRRVELYTTPEQNTIPLAPEKQLSIHELTHVFQMNSLNNGLTKALSFVLGEQIVGAVASYLPLWLLEGEAVFAETILTNSGRGRSPSFQNQVKALTLEKGKMYKYDKILNGSYRNFVPNHYETGYQMVAWALAKNDPQLWNKVFDYTGKNPYSFNPVNISLHRNSGLTKKKLHIEAFDSLRTIWNKELSMNNSVTYETINPDKTGKYINYYSPVFIGRDSILAIKTSLSDPASFMIINPSSKTEKRIHTPGQMYPWHLSSAKNKIVWVEAQSDHRWENRDYSIVKVMNLNNKSVKKISNRTRYLSASISPNGKTIAAVENTSDNNNNLTFFDSETGVLLSSVKTPDNVYIQRPQWSEDGEIITLIFLKGDNEGIMSFTMANSGWKILIPAGDEDIQSSELRNDSLFFVSSKDGNNNIFICTPDNNITSLTRSRFGAADLSIEGGTVLFSDYNSTGNSICSISLNGDTSGIYKKPYSSSFLIDRFKNLSKENDTASLTTYSPVPYRKWMHLFKFHSWMPFYADLEEIQTDPTDIRPGVTILSQNHLSSLISSIGYEYSEEKNHVFHTRLTWKGWYPVFESQLDYGNDPAIDKMGNNVENPSEVFPGLRFYNTVSLPLSFSSGKFSQFLRPSFTADYRNRYVYTKEDNIYDYGQTVLTGRVFFSNYHRSAMRDIYPRWAQSLDLNHTFAPFDNKIYGTSFAIKSAFYFPGFLPNNGIKIRLEKEKQNPVKYLYGNRVSYPRGYKDIISKELELYSVDYVLPLAYPDFNLSSLLYLKRIRTGLFYDYGAGTGNYYLRTSGSGQTTRSFNNYKETFRSFGFEMMADFYVLRIPFMISGGIQTAWKSFSETPTFELLFNIDLYGMSIGRNRM